MKTREPVSFDPGPIVSLLILLLQPLFLTPASPGPIRTFDSVRLDVPRDSTRVQQVRLVDGTLLIGRVQSVSGDSAHFESLSGNRFTFACVDVRSVGTARGKLFNGEYWADDPADSRLFFGPTGRVPGHGHGYAGVYELFFPSAAVGIGDRFMISGGISVFPGVDLEDQIAFFSPKLQLLKTEPVQASVGLFTIGAFWIENRASAGYAVLTGGDERVALTGGIAFPFSGGGDDFDSAYLFGGGEARLSRGIKLMGEGWLGRDGNPGLVMVGTRLIGDGFAVEFAALLPEGAGFVFPLASVTMGW